MRALLLSAGFGSRLKPITDFTPKCLVPINGKRLIDYWLEKLSDAGIERFLINTHYLNDKVEKYISSSKFSELIEVSYERELLLTAGTIVANKDFFQDKSFMLIHADNLSICDFSNFINCHNNRPKGTEITMMTFQTDEPHNCGIVELDERGIVCDFHEKIENPPSSFANAAVYILEPTVIEFIENLGKEKVDFSNEVLPRYMGRINTFFNDVYHRDIGSLSSYGLAQIELFDRF